MKEFLLTLYQSDEGMPPPEDMEKMMREVHEVNQEMKTAGAWVFGAPLHPPSTATVLRVQNDEMLTTDGPFLEGKEHVGGFLVIRAPDLDAALGWGRKYSRATTRPIEVRPLHEADQD